MLPRKLLLGVSALIGLLTLGTAAHAQQLRPELTVIAVGKCLSAKIKAEGKGAAAYLGCHSKGASKGTTTDPGCLAKASAKLVSAFAKLDGKDGCLTNGDGPDRDDATSAYAAIVDGTVGHAGKCDAAKSKAVGKYVAANMKCYAKAASKTGSVGQTCLAKAESKFIDDYFKTGGMSGCTDVNPNPNALTRGPANIFVDAETCLLSPGNPGCPVCGDNLVQPPGEVCDGTDDPACPGLCLPPGGSNACQCPVCGDGDANQPSEVCDGTDDAACPGACGTPDTPYACQCRPGCMADPAATCAGTGTTECVSCMGYGSIYDACLNAYAVGNCANAALNETCAAALDASSCRAQCCP